MDLKAICQHSSGLLRPVLDTVFPVHCAGCQKIGHVLCPVCIVKIQPPPLPICEVCGITLSTYGSCKTCQFHRPNLNGLRAVSIYEEPLRGCIHALKYDGNTRLALPLGLLLARAFRHYALKADMLIPVPLHRERQKHRGFNQASLLAEVCSAKIDIPMHENILIRHRPTIDQIELHPIERYQNVAGAFACSSPARNMLNGRKILLIDDVSTTGSTLDACATPLFDAGAQEVWGLVLARPLSW